MDYRALAELIWFTLLGVSILTLVLGFSVRAFLAPVIRDALAHLHSAADREQQLLGVRMEHLEDRLTELETSLSRVAAAAEFQHQIEAGRSERGGQEEA